MVVVKGGGMGHLIIAMPDEEQDSMTVSKGSCRGAEEGGMEMLLPMQAQLRVSEAAEESWRGRGGGSWKRPFLNSAAHLKRMSTVSSKLHCPRGPFSLRLIPWRVIAIKTPLHPPKAWIWFAAAPHRRLPDT